MEFHRAHGDLATMTVVRPELQFGIAELNGDGRVRGFREKPRTEHWVNGGFFCFEPGALGYIGEDSVLEREPLERLAADGQLHAYRHEGFWECMDTYKDAVHAQRHLGRGRRAVEGLGLMRSAFVTGGLRPAGNRRSSAACWTATWRSRCCAATPRPAPRWCWRGWRSG